MVTPETGRAAWIGTPIKVLAANLVPRRFGSRSFPVDSVNRKKSQVALRAKGAANYRLDRLDAVFVNDVVQPLGSHLLDEKLAGKLDDLAPGIGQPAHAFERDRNRFGRDDFFGRPLSFGSVFFVHYQFPFPPRLYFKIRSTSRGLGFEPRLPGPEPGVLPLDDPRKLDLIFLIYQRTNKKTRRGNLCRFPYSKILPPNSSRTLSTSTGGGFGGSGRSATIPFIFTSPPITSRIKPRSN